MFTDHNNKSLSCHHSSLGLNLGFEWACCCLRYTTCHTSTLASCLIVIMQSAWAPLLSGLSASADLLSSQSNEHQWLCLVGGLLPGKQANPLWPSTCAVAFGWEEKKNGFCLNSAIRIWRRRGRALQPPEETHIFGHCRVTKIISQWRGKCRAWWIV